MTRQEKLLENLIISMNILHKMFYIFTTTTTSTTSTATATSTATPAAAAGATTTTTYSIIMLFLYLFLLSSLSNIGLSLFWEICLFIWPPPFFPQRETSIRFHQPKKLKRLYWTLVYRSFWRADLKFFSYLAYLRNNQRHMWGPCLSLSVSLPVILRLSVSD